MTNKIEITAEKLYISAFSRSENLGLVSQKEKEEMFKLLAEICFEASVGFHSFVKENRDTDKIPFVESF